MSRQTKRRAGGLGASNNSRSATQGAFTIPDWEKFGRGGLLVVIGGLVGALMANFPTATSVWGILGFVVLYVYSHVRHRFGRWSFLVFIGTIVVATVCLVMAAREYTGANYKLRYRICGMGLLANPNKPVLSKLLFGVEFSNNNGRALYGVLHKHILTFADRNSVLGMSEEPFTIAPNESGAGLAKMDDWIIPEPQIPIAPQMFGEVHYEFLFGPKPEAMRQKLTVDGKIILTYFGDGSHQQFLFVPSKESSPTYDSTPCRIQDHSYGLTSE